MHSSSLLPPRAAQHGFFRKTCTRDRKSPDSALRTRSRRFAENGMFFPRLAIHASCRLALAITPPQRPLRYNRTVMARRSRKRKLKAASPPTIRSNSETPASPSKIPRDSEKVASYPDSSIPSEDVTSVSEFSFDSETIASLVDVSSDGTPSVSANIASPPSTAAVTANVAAPSAAPTGADRRTHPRYEFFAAAEVVPTESGARMETRVRDLS